MATEQLQCSTGTVQYSHKAHKSIDNLRDPCYARLNLFRTQCIPTLPFLAVGTPGSAHVRGPTPGIFSIISPDPVECFGRAGRAEPILHQLPVIVNRLDFMELASESGVKWYKYKAVLLSVRRSGS